MKKIDRELVTQCMLDNKDKDGEIYILECDKTGELEVAFMSSSWIENYCSQNQVEVVESFGFCPSDDNYNTDLETGSYEEGSFEREDAEYYLDRMDLDIID